ncbi:MAG TPA: DUF3108 domain-containing protein [Dissulfurispiraceae bacterium]|nr:DUF3108 domain-containing protein [Dissulfurispiraceae bacterium]
MSLSKITGFAVFVIAIIIFSQTAVPFVLPERLDYDLTWAGIKAGTASLETVEKDQYIQFVSRAMSSDFVSVFYRVDDLAVSSLKKIPIKNLPGTPYSYRLKTSEGKHRKDKEVYFDLAAKKAMYIDYLDKEQKSFDIGDSTMDALSCFYYVRFLPLHVGKSVFVDIFDNKKLYKAEIQVVKKEEIETPIGTFKTILIRPVLQSEGIFNRKGDIFIWLTDDERRVPVLLKTKVKVGAVKATITAVR